MGEYIANPRRAPRAPARCRAAVVSPAGPFEAQTEDIGARGCQVVSPRLVRKGDRVQLSVSNDKATAPLRVSGTVAWVSAQPPWRVGIAFDEAALPECKRWFEHLVSTHPGLAGFRRVPDRIPLDATVYLGAPPRFVLDFTAAEARVLRAIGSGVRVDELQARLRSDWAASQIALFSLLTRQAVTLSRSQAAHPDAWKKVLIEVEASLAVESLGSGPATLAAPPAWFAEPAPAAAPSRTPAPVRPSRTPPPVAPPASPWGTPPRDPHPLLDLDDDAPPLEVAAPPRAPVRAGVGRHARPPEAQEALDRARNEVAADNVNGAIWLLRRALALSPGDPEIADALAQLTQRDRDRRSR